MILLYIDGALYYEAACRVLGLENRERNMQTDKGYDSYFPCRKKLCMWEHVWSWIKLFNEVTNFIRRLTGMFTTG
jgi:hypothetical protein